MKSIILIVALIFLQSAPSVKREQEHPKKETPPTQETPRSSGEPTPPITPPVSQTLPKAAGETKDESKRWPPWSDVFWPSWALVIVTVIAVRAALKTLGSINAQVDEMRKTGEQTDKLIAENIAQSTSMQRSVSEAARLAAAMEVVSKEIAVSSKAATESVAALKDRTARQMRAYLCVVVGSGTFQEQVHGLKFAGSPSLINCGHTPAYKVSYRAKAAILPVPLPEDFTFPLPDESVGGSVLGPQQNAVLNAIVDDFCADEEVEGIKVGQDKVLYIWGIVNYKDVFGENHFTKFCQTVNFFRVGTENKVTGFYIARHDEAD